MNATLSGQSGTLPVDAEREYQLSVIRGEDDQEICEAACRTRAEGDRHRAGYQRRIAAKNTLDGSEQSEREAEGDVQAAARPLPELTDALTLGELRQLLRSIGPSVRVESPEELGRALALLSGERERRKGRAQLGKDAVRFAKQDALHLLLSTAGEPPKDLRDRVAGCKQAVSMVEQRIKSRQAVLTAEERIPPVRQRIEDIIAGRVSITNPNEWQQQGFYSQPQSFEQVSAENRSLLQRAKAVLSELLRLAKGQSEAEKENERDLLALATNKQELTEAEAEVRAWQMDPKNMRFD